MDEVHTRDMNAQTLMDEASPSSVLSKTLNCLHHCITTRLLQCLIFFLVVGGQVPSYLGSSFAFVAVAQLVGGRQQLVGRGHQGLGVGRQGCAAIRLN